MATQLIIFFAVFLCIAAMVGGIALVFLGNSKTPLENRLDQLTSSGGAGAKKPEQDNPTLLSSPLDETVSFGEALFSRFGNLRVFLEQADMRMHPTKFLMMIMGLVGVAIIVCFVAGVPTWAVPLVVVTVAVLPFFFVVFKRKRRMAAFGRQLPDALELISRALRAGHSLGAGFNLVGDEMADPIGVEFTRSYEEQNLGVPLEESLESMTERVPNLDLRFFATAVILQRTTGGDLAEILDKIGHLVRERFKIWGQIQALTGEGRLSGIVLLALPPVLFIVMYQLNPEYCELLWTDPMGKWMLAVAIVLQLVGALVIRKIINIKV